MEKIRKPEELDALSSGDVVYYNLFYDGMIHGLAEKFGDGKWYMGDHYDGFHEVVPIFPCYVVFRDGRPLCMTADEDE